MLNNNDRKLLGGMEAKVEQIIEDLKEIKDDVKSLIKCHYKQEEKLAGISISFSNHLKHHDLYFKMKQQTSNKHIKVLGITISGILGVLGILAYLGVI